jgi:hypothetical protein
MSGASYSGRCGGVTRLRLAPNRATFGVASPSCGIGFVRFFANAAFRWVDVSQPLEIIMKRFVWSSICAIAVLSAARPASTAGKCQDIPLRVTLYNNAVTDPTTGATTPSAIRSDGAGEYTSASIQICSGTYDAVTNLSGTKRTFVFAFPAPVPGSVIEAVPAWVPGTYAVSGWINIRNILYNKGSSLAFATMAGTTFTRSGDRTTYRFGFKGSSPDLPNAPNLHDPANTPGDNTPFASSPVVVYPNYPLACGTGSMPTWLVRATSPNSPGTTMEVGTLRKQASSPSGSDVHEGQYSMPFEMFIEALQCFAY